MRSFSSAALTAFALLLASQVVLGADSSPAPTVARLIERSLSSGQRAQLSPHLSVLLAVSSADRSTPIHQLGINAAGTLWLFDVCDDDHTHIVLMRVDGGKAVEAYAMTPAGALLKAVAYTVGGATHILSAAEAKAGFHGLLDFWIQKETALESAR